MNTNDTNVNKFNAEEPITDETNTGTSPGEVVQNDANAAQTADTTNVGD